MEKIATATRMEIKGDATGQIVATYDLDAPRERVFSAYIDPKLVAQWWGPRQYTVIVDMWDMKPGGRWRMLHRDTEGNEYRFHGVVHDVVELERIVQTFEFEGLPGHVSLETAIFEELPGGGTRVTTTSTFQSLEDRDGMLDSNMESGFRDSIEQLAELLSRL